MLRSLCVGGSSNEIIKHFIPLGRFHSWRKRKKSSVTFVLWGIIFCMKNFSIWKNVQPWNYRFSRIMPAFNFSLESQKISFETVVSVDLSKLVTRYARIESNRIRIVSETRYFYDPSKNIQRLNAFLKPFSDLDSNKRKYEFFFSEIPTIFTLLMDVIKRWVLMTLLTWLSCTCKNFQYFPWIWQYWRMSLCQRVIRYQRNAWK